MRFFTPARRLVRFSPSFAALLIAVLAGCSTPQPAAPPASVPIAPVTAPASAPPAPPAAIRQSLASEQVRLSDLFRGTPVVFAMQQDGSLRATVPLRFSFEAGGVKVKPPLAAVLDRLAKSQAQAMTKLRVAAPADSGARAGSPLAQDRAASLRDHLAAQGIAAARVQIAAKGPANLVEIVVSEATR